MEQSPAGADHTSPQNSGFLDVSRVEYLLTKRCTGWCEHCSVMTDDRNPDRSYEGLDAVVSASTVLYSAGNVTSMMVYGGEPLLYPATVQRLFQLARTHNVASRELITNGFFSRNPSVIADTVAGLVDSGVTLVHLSVDAFHQPRIPLPFVEQFITQLQANGFSELFLHPSWVVQREHQNEYNQTTEQLLAGLVDKYGVRVSQGNTIIPAGFNRHTLSDYYPRLPELPVQRCSDIPWANSPDKVHSLRFLPNGDVHICRAAILGNIYQSTITELLDSYDPFSDPILLTLLDQGVDGLVDQVASNGGHIDPQDYFGQCDLCADCMRFLKKSPQAAQHA
ncbi:hypothetical protein brsh051_24240 [Brooklawnia propionicigenes]|uniref:Radical SAM core domain-containing protein n=1 Tax=Brooklawnia propionicigenes TaxID=3041175 RepID=A0AAN0KH43_9ACTN|nr:radical SAM protein [Brooklawnia sp. SH051]BEH03143.1 hypothetical protein brsh051_24240 [Brooklawnia sp. SH051]